MAGTQRARFDATGLVIPTGSGISVPTLTATTSVVTSLVGTDASTDVNFKYGGTNIVTITGLNFYPSADNTTALGTATKRWNNVFTPIIDSGTTGSLSLKTNNGATQVVVKHLGSAVNNVALTGGVTASPGNVIVGAEGSDADILIRLAPKGTGSVRVDSAAGTLSQFEVLHTASSSRWITVTGSNGGNPTISTTAGSLAITPAVVIAGLISQGATPALTANINLPYASFIGGRRNDNTADIGLLAFGTTNGVTETVVIGDSSSTSAGVLLKGRSGGAAPNTSDISAGRWCIWRDTVGATTKLYYNNGGVIQSVALA